MYLLPHEAALRVNVYDGETQEQVASRIYLTDAIPSDIDEQQMASAELRKSGRYWVGGGAAPLFLLTLAR